MNEFDIIKRYFSPLAANESGALGLSDDAAIIDVPQGMELFVTKDAITEGVHFIGDELPSMIAKKLLRVNLSDLAAMGAKPYAYFLALMLPEKINENWLKSFTEGLRTDQENFGIVLMGGDTTRTYGTLSMSMTALGFVAKGMALRRNGAKAGDNIYVSGTIGDAALGLQVAGCKLQVTEEKGARVQGGANATTPRSEGVNVSEGGELCSPPYNKFDHYLLQRYQLPTPRVALGQALLGIATSCMDISDGLMQDLGHIAECSGVSAVMEWEKIPLSDAARMALPLVTNVHEMIAAGGDDYELLFTAPPRFREQLQGIAEKTGISITAIGSIKTGNGAKMIDKAGNDIYLSITGYNHFRSI